MEMNSDSTEKIEKLSNGTQLNNFKYFYQIRIILYSINCLHTFKFVQIFLSDTNNFIYY